MQSVDALIRSGTSPRTILPNKWIVPIIGQTILFFFTSLFNHCQYIWKTLDQMLCLLEKKVFPSNNLQTRLNPYSPRPNLIVAVCTCCNVAAEDKLQSKGNLHTKKSQMQFLHAAFVFSFPPIRSLPPFAHFTDSPLFLSILSFRTAVFVH